MGVTQRIRSPPSGLVLVVNAGLRSKEALADPVWLRGDTVTCLAV